MPTLNYKIETKCLNCGALDTIKAPLGSQFIESRPTIANTLLGDHTYTESGYYRNYGKADHKTIKRCRHCRVPALVRIKDAEA